MEEHQEPLIASLDQKHRNVLYFTNPEEPVPVQNEAKPGLASAKMYWYMSVDNHWLMEFYKFLVHPNYLNQLFKNNK